MKKILFFALVMGFFCCACTKNCTCSLNNSATGTQNIQELEVAYNENCADYSNLSMDCK